MPQDESSGRIKGFFQRLFGAEDRQLQGVARYVPAEDKDLKPEEKLPSGNGDPPAGIEISASTMTITEKLNILKKTFEFESNLKGRLEEVRSNRELVIFIHDAFLFRFEKLREIGLIGAESYAIFESLNERLGAVLGGQASEVAGGEPSLDPQELLNENIELKQRIESLHARYVKSGIITDAEMAQESEIKYLQSRVREQHNKLKIAAQRLKVLSSYQEMIQGQKARISLLNSKVDHQSKLIRSLAASSPRHQELMTTVERLNDENKRLKHELERQSDLLIEMKRRMPAEDHPMVEELIGKNTRLMTDLDAKDQQLDAVSQAAKGDLLEYIDSLTEKNTRLRDILSAKKSIDQFMKEQDSGSGKGDPGRIIEALQQENQTLEEALRTKEAQIQALAADPSNRELMRAYSRLQSDFREILKEKEYQATLLKQEQDEKQALVAQTKERTALHRENRQLRAQLEASNRFAELLKKADQQNKALKKARAEAEVKYDRAVAELEAANKKLAKMNAEYGLLMGEYRKLFDEPG